jgi:hypothetical protein
MISIYYLSGFRGFYTHNNANIHSKNTGNSIGNCIGNSKPQQAAATGISYSESFFDFH